MGSYFSNKSLKDTPTEKILYHYKCDEREYDFCNVPPSRIKKKRYKKVKHNPKLK